MRWVAAWAAGLCIIAFVIQQLGVRLAWQVGVLEPQLFLSVIAHAGIAHLLGNLLGLLLFGLILEGVTSPRVVLGILALSAAAGQLAALLGSYSSVLGISAAVLGLVGALSALRPRMVIWAAGLPMPMLLAGIGYAIVSILGSLAITSTGHLAHLLGFLAGALGGLVLRKKYPPPPRRKRRLDPDTEARIDALADQMVSR